MTFNLVMINPLVYEYGLKSILPRSQLSNTNLFIVDENIVREYANIVTDDGVLDDKRRLSALQDMDNVFFSKDHARWFKLPEGFANLPTLYLYFKSDKSIGIESPFDVMCATGDFPRSSDGDRRYAVIDRADNFSMSFDGYPEYYDFYSGGPISGRMFDYKYPKELGEALIEWLLSGFDKVGDATFSMRVNVYNRVLIDNSVVEKRPMWTLNADTPSIRGLLISVGLYYEDLTPQFATSYTDGKNSQLLIFGSEEYRREMTENAIKVLVNFALANNFLTKDEIVSMTPGNPELWRLFLSRV